MIAVGLRPLDIPVTLGRGEAQRRAAAELAKAKYGGVPDWVTNVLAALRRFLARLADWLLLSPAGGGSANLLVVVVAVLLVAAVGIIIWRVGLPRLRHRSGAEADLAIDPTRSPASYRTQADAAADAGDFRAAIGDRFRAVVRELEERTILDPRPARTANEVATTAAVMLSGHRDSLSRAAALFSDSWYGDGDADRDGYALICDLDTELTAAADHADLTDSTDLTGPVGAGAGAGAGAGLGVGAPTSGGPDRTMGRGR